MLENDFFLIWFGVVCAKRCFFHLVWGLREGAKHKALDPAFRIRLSYSSEQSGQCPGELPGCSFRNSGLSLRSLNEPQRSGRDLGVPRNSLKVYP